MPAHKKDASVRARRNKAPTAATLKVVQTVDYSDWTLADLRREVEQRNAARPEDAAQLPRTGGKAKLIEALEADDQPWIPELPTHPPRVSIAEDGERFEWDVEWDLQTLAWWADVWTSPMSKEWDRSDLHNVVVVALLYDDIWKASSAKERKDALAEYRLQRADLGLSPYARRRLEWTIETAEDAKAKGAKRREAGTRTGPAQSSKGSKDPRAGLHAVN